MIDVTAIPESLFPKFQDIFEQHLLNAHFLYLSVKFDIFPLYPGSFKPTVLFESTRYRHVECTTTIYSYGRRVLETKEIQVPSLYKSRFFYNFQFVEGFFNAFLNGLKYLTGAQRKAAVENLAGVQVT